MGEYQRLIDAMTAAGFSSRELGIIAETSMGVTLDGVTQATDPAEQAMALVQFAERYGLLANLRRAVLYTGADRPSLQNMLLGETMPGASDGQQGNATYIMLRLEAKVDQVLSGQARQAQQVAEIARQQADAHRRIDRVEAITQKPMGSTDRILVLMMVLLMAGLMAFTVYGSIRP